MTISESELTKAIEVADAFRKWICDQPSDSFPPMSFFDQSKLNANKRDIHLGAIALMWIARDKGDIDHFQWWLQFGLPALRQFQPGVGDKPVGFGSFVTGESLEDVGSMEEIADSAKRYLKAVDGANGLNEIEEQEEDVDNKLTALIVNGEALDSVVSSWIDLDRVSFHGTQAEVVASAESGFTPVRSSLIDGVRYDAVGGRLTLRFRGGREYDYCGVDEETYRGFLATPSKVRFYHSRIKGRYQGADGSPSSTTTVGGRSSSPQASSTGCLAVLVLLGGLAWMILGI